MVPYSWYSFLMVASIWAHASSREEASFAFFQALLVRWSMKAPSPAPQKETATEVPEGSAEWIYRRSTLTLFTFRFEKSVTVSWVSAQMTIPSWQGNQAMTVMAPFSVTDVRLSAAYSRSQCTA